MPADAALEKAPMPSERLNDIRVAIERQGRMRVADIAARFGVSSETARRDLRRLAATGDAVLVRGGAMAPTLRKGVPPGLPPVSERQIHRMAEKDAIGRAAAGLVVPGQVVLLDGGTTTLAIARALRPLNDLTIVTNNLTIAAEIGQRAGWRIHVIGGELAPASMSLVGLEALRGLQDIAADLGFIGAAGASEVRGFTSADPFESELKRRMMEVCRKRVVVADASKLASSGFAPFAKPSEIDVFVTSPPLRLERIQAMRDAGLEVVIAQGGDDDA